MLNKTLDQEFKLEGVSIKLDIPFNNVLLFYELQEDERYTQVEKIEMSFDLLCRCRRKISLDLKVKAIQHIFDNYINVVKLKGEKETKKVFDFNHDAGYIYAAFMQEYGIDLYNEMDKLDWRKFIFLFHGLSGRCKILEIIGIRSRKIPKRTKHNQEEIDNLMKLKSMYQLEMTTEEREKQFAESLRAFADKLIQGR